MVGSLVAADSPEAGRGREFIFVAGDYLERVDEAVEPFSLTSKTEMRALGSGHVMFIVGLPDRVFGLELLTAG